ncbi:MAG: 6-hydroxymethylpterin diphosphokinase MptE-like protein, partial [Treponemataceae bacterium]
MNANSEKPCLVTARQGFSVLYKEKYLYSQYDPQKSIKAFVSSLSIAPDTLFLCFSPVLCYGLTELLEKISNNCFILAIESDNNLDNFSKEYQQKYYDNPNIKFLFLSENENFFQTIANACNIIDYRRCIPIDLCAGSNLQTIFYKKIAKTLTQEISQ